MKLVNQNAMYKTLLLIEDAGETAEHIFNKFNIDFEKVKNQELVLTDQKAEELWQYAIALTGNTTLGFKIGRKLKLKYLGLLGQIFINARSIGGAIKLASSYLTLMSDGLFNMTYQKKDNKFVIELIPNEIKKLKYPIRTEQASLLALGAAVKICDRLILDKNEQKNSALQKLIYKLEVPDSITNIENLQKEFDTLYESSSDGRYRFHGDLSMLDWKIVNADLEVLNYLIEYAKGKIVTANQEWTSKVEQFTLNYYNGKFPSLEEIAAHFELTPRTLQRYLKKEKSSHSKVIDKVRFEFAKYHLKNADSIQQTARLLDFSGASSFSKAFKRWSGMTITDYIKSTKEE